MQTNTLLQSKIERIHLFAMLTLFAALTFSTALVEISFGVAILSWFWLKNGGRDIPQVLREIPGIAFLLAYLGCVLIGALTSENYALSFKGVLKVLQHLSIFVMSFDLLRNKRHFKLFTYFLIALSVVVVANSFFQYFVGQDFIRGFKGAVASSGIRVSGSFKSYGLLAAFLVMVMPVLLAISWKLDPRSQPLWLKVLAISMTLGFLVLLVLTRSRGPILAVMVCVVLMLIVNRRFLILGIAAALGLAALFVVPKEMIMHLDREGKEQSIVERLYLWERAINVIEAKPILGTGINTYAESHLAYDSRQSWRVRRYYAHNGYLQMAAETGLPSLFFYACFLVAVFQGGVSVLFNRMKYPGAVMLAGLMAGLFNFVLTALVDTVMHNPLPVMTFWFLLGVYVAIPGAFKEGEFKANPKPEGALLNV